MSYINVVREFVIESFLFGNPGEFNEETSFLQSGIIDSTGILELVSFLEETYGITIQDEELIPENFDSLNNIDKFLFNKLNDSHPVKE
jgi:acyl carrier protein